jgi:hypothetical protein
MRLGDSAPKGKGHEDEDFIFLLRAPRELVDTGGERDRGVKNNSTPELGSKDSPPLGLFRSNELSKFKMLELYFRVAGGFFICPFGRSWTILG